MKKLRDLVLILTCLAIVAAGCGKKAEAPSPDVNVKSTAPEAPGQAKTTAEKPGKATPTVAAKPGDVWSQMSAARTKLNSYTMVMSHEGQTMKQSVKLDNGRPSRMRADIGGGRWALVQIDKKVQYMYDPQQKAALKAPMTSKELAVQDAAVEGLKSKKPAVSDATIDGMPTWKMTAEGSTVWIDKEYGLPRQMTSGAKTIKVTYQDINKVPDNVFELPKGTAVKDMSEMMKNMPKPPQGGR